MKNKAIIVSDIHLGTKDSKTKELIHFLEQNPTDLLILNGDIVDGWALERGSKWKKSHMKVINKILKLSMNTKIVWLRGNHDDFLSDFIGTSLGNIEIREDFILKFKDESRIKRKYFIFHGDIIDIFITKHMWLAKIGSIGYDLVLWLNRWYNKYREFRNLPYRSISQEIKNSVKAATNHINDFEINAIELAAKHGCDGVICGHIHHPANRNIHGLTYLNSGDWVENMTSIVIDSNGRIKIKKY